jgi:hypothetical protein
MRKLLITTLFFLVAARALAQKDLPVSGHAATLIELLKKDFSSIDPETRAEEISRDQTLVIALFKSYLTDSQIGKLKASFFEEQDLSKKSARDKNIKNLYQNYNAKKNGLGALKDVAGNGTKNAESNSGATSVTGKTEEVYEAKNKYYGEKFRLDSAELADIASVYEDSGNKLIRKMIGLFEEKYDNVNRTRLDKFASVNTTASIQKAGILPFGDIGFDKIIDGLAKFIAKTLKEQLVAIALDRVKIWLQDPSQDDPLAELKVVLPTTTNFLLTYRGGSPAKFPDEIKGFLEEDFNKLQEHLPRLLNTPRLKKLTDQNPDLAFGLEAMAIVPNVSKMRNPADLFGLLEKSRRLSLWKVSDNMKENNIANTVALLAMFARSLTVIDNGELRFVSTEFMTTYGQEVNFYRLYMGFLYQQNLKYYNVRFKPTPASDLVLANELNVIVNTNVVSEDLKRLVDDILTRATSNAEKIAVISHDIKSAKLDKKKISADTIYNFVDNIVGLSEDMVGSIDTLMKELVKLHNNVQRPGDAFIRVDLKKNMAPYFTVARKSNDVIHDLGTKKFASALFKALEIPTDLGSNTNFGNLISAVENLKVIHNNANIAYWHQVIKFINANETVPGKDVKRAFTTTNAELAKIILYYKINNPAGLLARRLTGLQNCLRQGANLTAINAQDLSNARTLLIDDAFKKLLLGYYASVNVDDLITRAMNELKVFQATDKNGQPIRVFDDDAIQDLNFAFSSFIKALYDGYLIDGVDQYDKRLIEARKNLQSTITGYLVVLPQKFDIRMNEKLKRLVLFVNNIANSKNSDDAEAAFEALAGTSNGYLAKRENEFNVAVNAYPGILLGADFARSGVNNEIKAAFAPSFTVPVGVSLGWGTRKEATNGLFISLIDIGAITRLRLDDNDSTKTLPEFTFKNIFAPGIYFSHGFRKTGLGYQIGMQYGPELQKINTDGTANVSKTGLRFNFGFVYDIPFNIYTKPHSNE